ncbi:hypothetical protein WN944_022639 [Citrus x changshan-huyou]|uniref:Uncharacterized protein n=1 Tax=Citrus x changshan-huyou TaxID=2935761 RepID=A0AAP0MYR7_9ROSI
MEKISFKSTFLIVLLITASGIAALELPRAEAITDAQIPCTNNGECLRKCPSKSGFCCDPEKGLVCRPKGVCICV